MSRKSFEPWSVGRRMRARREELGLSQEKVGVEIGLDESSSRARISRYESGVHEPPVRTAQAIAKVLKVPLAYLYCEDDQIASVLLVLERLAAPDRMKVMQTLLEQLDPGA